MPTSIAYLITLDYPRPVRSSYFIEIGDDFRDYRLHQLDVFRAKNLASADFHLVSRLCRGADKHRPSISLV